MSKLFNRAKMTTTTAGTGNLTLGSAASGFVTFAAAGVVNGDVVRYCIEAENGTDFEIGEGSYTASGTVLSRADADVQLSSNSNNRITLAAGTHNVFITAADSDFTQEITVTVAGGKFVIDGTSQQIITLLPSITYRLDQSDSSNASHPLVLASGSADGSTYSTGVRTVGTPGSSGAYTEVKLEQDVPAIWYKCSAHSGMGASVNTGAASGGGVTSVANQSAMLALSSPSVGDMVYRQDNYKLMMYNGSGWYAIATINTSPTVSGVSQTTNGSTSAIAANGTFAMTAGQSTTVTVTGADADEGTTLSYSATVTSGTQSNVLASLTNSNNVFTLAPASSVGGTITIRFDVSDSAAVGNQSASFSIAFSILNSQTTSILLHASAAGVNTVSDSSSTGHTVTVSGAAVGSFSPYRASAQSQSSDLLEYNPSAHGGSIHFDGNDFLTLPTQPVIGSGDFEISMWVYQTSQSSDQVLIDFRPAGANGNYINLLLAAGVPKLHSNSDRITGGSAISANTWTFLTLTRVSNSTKLYVGTSQTGSTYSDTTNYLTGSSRPAIATAGLNTSLAQFNGYISDLVIKNTGNSSPSIPTAVRTTDSNTVLHLKCIGAKITDKSQNSNLRIFNDAVGHATTKFSGAFSTYFDGSDYIIPGSTLALGTSSFTLETWVNQSDNGGDDVIFDYRPSNGSGNYLIWIIDDGVPKLISGGSTRITAGSTLSTGTWYHLAVCRDASASSTKMFINGAQTGSTYSDSTNYLTATDRPAIGNTGFNFGLGLGINGYLQDFRVRLRAEYTSNFTPPAAPLEG